MRNPLRPGTIALNSDFSVTISWQALQLVFLFLLVTRLSDVAIVQTAMAQVGEIPPPRIARTIPGPSPTAESTSQNRLVQRQRELYEELSQSLAALQAQSAVLRKIVFIVRPSVVHIIADKKQPVGHVPPYDNYGDYQPDNGQPDNGEHHDGPPPEAYVEEAGSGVVIEIDNNAYVLTNRHVIRDATIDHIRVEFTNGRQIKPTRKWSDESTDIALLAIKDKDALPARLGNSSHVEIGDIVLAIGSPFGLNHSVTSGIISAKGRRDLMLGIDDVRIQNFLQTDAAINPGNSGGPLINTRGEVIGLNTAIASNSGGNEGIGFSIPINMCVQVGRQLIRRGSLARPYLGVTLDHNYGAKEAQDAGLPRRMGTRVAEVSPGSPAERAELKPSDVILEFNDVEIEDDGHLVNLVGLSPLGTEALLQIYRDGKYLTLIVSIEERHGQASGNDSESRGDRSDATGSAEADGGSPAAGGSLAAGATDEIPEDDEIMTDPIVVD